MRYYSPFGTAAVVAVVAFMLVAGVAVRADSPTYHSKAECLAQYSLGTNLAPFVDYVSQIPEADAFKASRPWISGSQSAWDDGRKVDVDEHGWVRSLLPGQIARTLMFWGRAQDGGVGSHYPVGSYNVYYTGSGTIQYGGSASLVSSSPGHDVIRVDPNSGGIMLVISAVTAGNPIKDIQVILPGCERGQLFNPAFLAQMKKYKVLRFMDWMLGQARPVFQESWETRPTLESARWSDNGVPVEVMVELCNQTGCAPWFCMSHTANDDYVDKFAKVVAAKLNPALPVFVEHSNEVWNNIYPQNQYCARQGASMALASDPNQATMMYHAIRTKQIGAIFARSIPPNRLVRCLGAMAANPWIARVMLQTPDVASGVDALAVAPYFTLRPPDQTNLPAMTVDQVFNILSNTNLPGIMDRTAQNGQLAAQYHLPMIAYEGGQDLVAMGPWQRDAACNTLLDNANRDPRMGQLYDRMFQLWNQAGGQLFVNFTNVSGMGQYGRCGSLEYMDSDPLQMVKYQALQRYLAAHP
ncbi:MAG TPA: hypothetical protein VGK19_17990 [Capsulimonadaceae bacterium]|jgi:hypothetical protein